MPSRVAVYGIGEALSKLVGLVIKHRQELLEVAPKIKSLLRGKLNDEERTLAEAVETLTEKQIHLSEQVEQSVRELKEIGEAREAALQKRLVFLALRGIEWVVSDA